MIAQDTMNRVHERSARQDAAYATAVDHSANGVYVPWEWHPTPGQPTGLWDMLEFDARNLYVLFNRITQTCVDMSYRMAEGRKANPPKRLIIQPEQGNQLNESILEPLECHCHELALDSAQDQIERIRKFLANGGPCSECVNLFQELYSRIIGQLKRRSFFHLPVDKIPYYKADKLLGSEVDAKFPDAREDIAEAGNCFATDRFTACVFHLMRVMEHGVRAFGARLGIPEKITHQREWGRILRAAEGKINRLPNKTPRTRKKREGYSAAWSLLDRVREAWRNPTMHPKASYTEEQTRDVIGSVRAFMTRLAKIV